MAMPTIDILGQKILVNIVNQHSGEVPESACKNILTGAKIGETTYQYRDVDPLVAIRKIAAAVAARAALDPSFSVPKMITVVVSHFYQETTIDWNSAVSSLAKLEAQGIEVEQFLRAATNRASR